jgi:rare lipoprotein A
VEPGPRLAQALIRPGALASWAIALALAGCATGPALVKTPPPEIPAPQPAPAPAPKVAPRPEEATGTASWYGKAHHGQQTASGETYDMHAFTAAHRSLPLGTRVLVTNVQNARTVEVRINDRGPFARGRILDLSYAAALELGSLSGGAFRVKLRVLEEPAGARAGLSLPAKTAAGAPGAPVSAP